METKIYDDDNKLKDKRLAEELQRARRASELGYDMMTKPESELWDIVADACRQDTMAAWRAFERLHSKYSRQQPSLSRLKSRWRGLIQDAKAAAQRGAR